MKRLALIAVLVSVAAVAGELCTDANGRLMVLMARGASTNNKGGTGDAGFLLPASQKITVQCSNPDAGTTVASTICINQVTCTTRLGLTITGNQALPTSTAQNKVTLADGGQSALISAIAGTDWSDCLVCTRAGNEF